MTEEVAKKVSELYKKKSEITDSISKIMDVDNKFKGLGYYYGKTYIFGTSYVNLDFIPELKEFCLTKLNEQLKAIDDEIANIDCKQ